MLKFSKHFLSQDAKYAFMYNEEENWCISANYRAGHHAIEFFEQCYEFAKIGNEGNIEATAEDFLEVEKMAYTALRLKITEGTKSENEFIKNEFIKNEVLKQKGY